MTDSPTPSGHTEGPRETGALRPSSESSSGRRTVLRRVLLGGTALLVTGLTAAAGTVIALTKTVTITVDGQATTVSTMAGDVAGALSAAGIDVGENDELAPAPDADIADGGRITIERGRLVSFTLDDRTEQYWTTADTVDAVIAELGYSENRMQLSAARSRTIGLDGIELTAHTLHTVSLTDGAAKAVTEVSTTDTVAEFLAESGVELEPLDRISPALTTAMDSGLEITIDRVTRHTETESEELPQPKAKRVEDPELAVGTEEVRRKGSPGSQEHTFQVTVVNGKAGEPELLTTEVIAEPVQTVIAVGTKEPVRWVGNQVFFDDFEFGINWDGLAKCESTNNPRAVDPSGRWYGLFQFDLRTWGSVGGTGNPAEATPMEQLTRAKLLYQSRGLQPWACGHAAY